MYYTSYTMQAIGLGAGCIEGVLGFGYQVVGSY